MENASKALIIAGAILISLLIISLGVFVFKTFSDTVDKNANMSKQEIGAFNERIIPYTGENVGGAQVNALIQLARSINQKEKAEGNDENSPKYMHLTLKDSSDATIRTSPTSVEIGKYYIVNATPNSSGLFTIITIKEQN